MKTAKHLIRQSQLKYKKNDHSQTEYKNIRIHRPGPGTDQVGCDLLQPQTIIVSPGFVD